MVSAVPSNAQPVEAVPLAAPNYTLQTETDPMAMDQSSTPAPTAAGVNRGPVEIAPPPPGADDQTGTSFDSTSGGATSSTYDAPAPLSASDMHDAQAPAASYTPSQSEERTMQAYPNNAVTGVVPKDNSKFSNMTFCTLKVSFSSIGTGIDHKTAERIKTYLDSQSANMTYKTMTWGKEGEFDYCIDIPAHNMRGRTYGALKRMLPERDNRDRRTMLSGEGFTQTNTSN